MEWKAVGALSVMFLTAPATSEAQITVKTYNNFGVSADDLAAARPHVETVFEEAGIDVTWVDCWYRDKEVSETATLCRQPLKANEVVLRLQATTPLPGKRHVSMGFALVNVPEGVPFLATVYADLVRTVARDAHLDLGRLLGRAIAHELGHLLLDTNRHADNGLMRAGWSNAELRDNAKADWAFRADEIAVIRTASAMRNNP